MSRAFVKEDGPESRHLPDLPLSQHPNPVTPSGFAQLQARLAARQADLASLRARTERLDRMPEAAAERDIRYLEARLRTARLTAPPDNPVQVSFGVTVLVGGDDGTTHRYRIVGEDEADAKTGLITPQSPLARALIGAGVGDSVAWRGGALTVLAILSRHDIAT
jgi:transcription elongation factor GreB